MAAYAAAAIAKANWITIAWIAIKLAMPAFVLPSSFLNQSGILFQGGAWNICFAFVKGIIGVGLLAIGNIGYLITRIYLLERLGFVVSGALIIYGGVTATLAGLDLGTALMLYHILVFAYGRKIKEVTVIYKETKE